MNLKPSTGEHGVFIGKTGTGKSELAKRLLPKNKIAIIDPKQEFDFDSSIKVYDKAKNIIRDKPTRFIFRPHAENLSNLSEYDVVYEWLYNRGDVTVYTDELAAFTTSLCYPHYLKVCYQLGRSKRITMLGSTQRPSSIPIVTLSECTHFYAFRVTMPQDIKKTSSFVPGYNVQEFQDQHEFFYHSVKTNTSSRYLLKLKE
jgi:energy-coupling factor transporter ATP-binding protein EcfA2